MPSLRAYAKQSYREAMSSPSLSVGGSILNRYIFFMNRIFLLLSIISILVLSSLSAEAISLPSWNSETKMNILYILKDSSKVNFFAVKYDSTDKFIRVCFIDENISVVSSSKNKKFKTLKEIFLETEDAKQISTAKSEIEKIFNNKIKFDRYILFDEKFLNKVVNIFSKEKDLQDNINLLKISYSSDDRYTADIASVKILDNLYNNINRWNMIDLLKSFYKKDFTLKTNFNLKEILFAYPKILNENKIFKYADVPVITKKNSLRIDSTGVEKIVSFFSDNGCKYDNSALRIEILNTTTKSRMAIKAANKLRENEFDVFDWGSNSNRYAFTIIFDFVDNYEKAVEIKKILNCGEIIFKPEERDFTDISVQLGEDCFIYDKLDRNDN